MLLKITTGRRHRIAIVTSFLLKDRPSVTKRQIVNGVIVATLLVASQAPAYQSIQHVFDGFQVLHWPAGAEGRGVLMSGDQPQVCMDRRWVSFMYSYPNFTPLGPGAVKRIAGILEPYRFDRIHGAFPRRTVACDAKAALQRSVERYLRSIDAR